jgi:hypothetical protein
VCGTSTVVTFKIHFNSRFPQKSSRGVLHWRQCKDFGCLPTFENKAENDRKDFGCLPTFENKAENDRTNIRSYQQAKHSRSPSVKVTTCQIQNRSKRIEPRQILPRGQLLNKSLKSKRSVIVCRFLLIQR